MRINSIQKFLFLYPFPGPNTIWLYCVTLFIYYWVCLFCWGFLYVCSRGIWPCTFIFWWYLCVVWCQGNKILNCELNFAYKYMARIYRGASLVAQMVKNLPAMQETWVWSLVGKIPWRRERQPTPVFLPEESHGRRRLVGHSPWGHKGCIEDTWSTLLVKLKYRIQFLLCHWALHQVSRMYPSCTLNFVPLDHF